MTTAAMCLGQKENNMRDYSKMPTVYINHKYKTQCDQCGAQVPIIITVGELPCHKRAAANLCIDCMEKSIRMLQEAIRKDKEDNK